MCVTLCWWQRTFGWCVIEHVNTNAHVLIYKLVRTIIDKMHSPTNYVNVNHHYLMSNPNFTSAL